jgi:hypothetical protein
VEEGIAQRQILPAEESQSLIDGQLSPVLQLMAELVATKDPERRSEAADGPISLM